MDSVSTSISAPGESIADWCQIKETLTMLYPSSAQIESSMHEDTTVFQQLSDAMVSIATVMNQQVILSITSSQFHGRNTQRLERLTSALSKVCHILSNSKKYHSQDNWQLLQLDIKASYTIDTEHLMSEHIMMGASVEETVEIYEHNFNQKELKDDTGDDIELF